MEHYLPNVNELSAYSFKPFSGGLEGFEDELFVTAENGPAPANFMT